MNSIPITLHMMLSHHAVGPVPASGGRSSAPPALLFTCVYISQYNYTYTYSVQM